MATQSYVRDIPEGVATWICIGVQMLFNHSDSWSGQRFVTVNSCVRNYNPCNSTSLYQFATTWTIKIYIFFHIYVFIHSFELSSNIQQDKHSWQMGGMQKSISGCTSHETLKQTSISSKRDCHFWQVQTKIKLRLQFANDYKHWSIEDCENIAWSAVYQHSGWCLNMENIYFRYIKTFGINESNLHLR